MAGKSKSQSRKLGKSASQKRGLLSEEDRSLWQRVVDSIETRRSKNNRGRTKHSVAPMAVSDEPYSNQDINQQKKLKTAIKQHGSIQANDKNNSANQSQFTKASAQHNTINKQDDLSLWNDFKSTLDHQKPKQKTLPKPIKPVPKAPPIYTKPSAPVRPAQLQPTQQRALPQSNTLQHHPLEDHIAKKLAKKKISIDARIDLHGMTQDQAHRALEGFLINAQKNALSIVLVITGKGAQGQGVLRHVVPQWLHSEPFAHMNNGFRHANAQHGGTGALYVRIRKQRNGR